ncbi:NAD(P)H-dependent oxidoreductase [Klebsiella sp. I138]|uniref:NAD(P)H-dependent oxidoreductase n=1 Tax=Klebsiella sp. I138 TaxID=2755385 RepID=UPI003DA7D7C5
MSQVLVLKSSINGQASLTNQLIDEYMQMREAAGQQDHVTERRLTDLELPVLDSGLFAALRGVDDPRPAIQRGVALSDTLIGELKASELLVIGAPMYNLNVPTDLKKWFDLVARARHTFRYTETWPQGLVDGVRAVIVSSRGGIHCGQDSDAVTPYLRSVLALMGISEVTFIYAEGMDIRPHGRDAGIAHAREHLFRLAYTV